MPGDGGGEHTGDLTAAGKHHHAAHDLVQTVHGGDIVVLSLCPVMLAQQRRHTPALFAVLGQHARRLEADDQMGILVQNGQIRHNAFS